MSSWVSLDKTCRPLCSSVEAKRVGEEVRPNSSTSEERKNVLVDEAQCRRSGMREFSLKENSARTGRLPRLVFLGHRGRVVAVNGNSVFTHLRDRQLFPRVATPLHISTSSMPCNCSRSLSTLVTVFFRTGILVGVKQYPIVTSICISLVTNPSTYTGYCIFFSLENVY